ncbi:hypothetical protein V8C26DRAFT_394687 [Trichoderma gracile]
MASSVQDIVRILHAAGGFIPDVDGTEYYVVVEESNELSEMHWFGSQLAGETFIASEIRTNSPAVYAAHDDTRSVFCVGEDDALRLFTLWEDEWHEVGLTGNGSILVHPSSRMSGCVDGSDSLVFFEDYKGRIRGVRVQPSGSWRFLRSFSVDSVLGNPHFAQIEDGVLYLSYVNRDNYIHQMGMRIASNLYYDSPLPGTNFNDAPIANFIVGIHSKIGNVVPDETDNEPRDEPEFYLVALTRKTERKTEELVRIDDNGKQTVMGKILNGVFGHMSDEENNDRITRTMASAVTKATGGSRGNSTSNATGGHSGRNTTGARGGSTAAGSHNGRGGTRR